MYEINAIYKEYFQETDPLKRIEILKSLKADAEASDTNASVISCLERLFKNRHEVKGKPLGEADKFLYNCVVLISMQKGGVIFKGVYEKNIKKMMKEMGALDVTDSKEESLLYWEFRNAASRYFETCANPGYRKKLFGMMNSNDEEKRYQMLSDAWKMSVGILDKLKDKETARLWADAVEDEFAACYEGAKADLLNYKP